MWGITVCTSEALHVFVNHKPPATMHWRSDQDVGHNSVYIGGSANARIGITNLLGLQPCIGGTNGTWGAVVYASEALHA